MSEEIKKALTVKQVRELLMIFTWRKILTALPRQSRLWSRKREKSVS